MLLELLSAITTKMLYLILHIENAGSFPKPLSAKEEKKALEQMASGDTEAKNRLIEHNLRLVAHIIKKYYTHFHVICKGDVPDGFFNSDARFRAIFHLRRHILSKLQM